MSDQGVGHGAHPVHDPSVGGQPTDGDMGHRLAKRARILHHRQRVYGDCPTCDAKGVLIGPEAGEPSRCYDCVEAALLMAGTLTQTDLDEDADPFLTTRKGSHATE